MFRKKYEGNNERSPFRRLNWAATAAGTAGTAILNPAGLKDAAIAWANQRFGLGMPLETEPWYGIVALVAALVLFLPHVAWEFGWWRTPAATKILALRHVSLNVSVPNHLKQGDLPSSLAKVPLTNLDCDQTLQLSSGALKFRDALRKQEKATEDILVHRRTDSGTVVAYYGIAHIPLQVLLGYQLTTAVRAELFELGQAAGRWRHIAPGSGADLAPSLSHDPCTGQPVAAIVRVSVSAEVALADCTAIVAGPHDEFHVKVAKPARDIVTHADQVNRIAGLFRDALDAATRRLPQGARIHVFAAVPMSVGCSMGRLVSQSMHGEVVVYNFSSQRTPRYSWGLRINVLDQGLSQVVQPTPVGVVGTVGEYVD
jgi:hypothetical protein